MARDFHTIELLQTAGSIVVSCGLWRLSLHPSNFWSCVSCQHRVVSGVQKAFPVLLNGERRSVLAFLCTVGSAPSLEMSEPVSACQTSPGDGAHLGMGMSVTCGWGGRRSPFLVKFSHTNNIPKEAVAGEDAEHRMLPENCGKEETLCA